MFVYDGQVTGHHGMGTALHEPEYFLLARGVQVIEEDSSNTPSLSAVSDEKVSVTPRNQKNWGEEKSRYKGVDVNIGEKTVYD